MSPIIAVHSPGVIHEVAVPPANKLYYSIAILVINISCQAVAITVQTYAPL